MKLIRVASVCLLISLAGGSVMADAIYKWRDAKGKVHFGDRPPVTEESTPVTVKPNLYHAPEYEPIVGAGFSPEKVVMYSTKRCGYCKQAREYFKRNKIHYVEYDVETSQKGRRDYKKLKGTGVPIILVGKRRMNGFTEAGFQEVYQKK
ncbi:MAG: glutaredoxin family protein [Candidatus Thiodiazotropha sp.]